MKLDAQTHGRMKFGNVNGADKILRPKIAGKSSALKIVGNLIIIRVIPVWKQKGVWNAIQNRNIHLRKAG